MDIIRQIHKLLINKKKTIAVAESCTGGLISAALTSLSGSSRYLILGITSYSNKAKEVVLKIPHSVIKKNGAVSKETAELMAKNVRNIAKAQVGISTTGIAGPTGGTAEKPVGTVFICLSTEGTLRTKKLVLKGNRQSIRKQTLKASLNLIKKYI